MGMMPGRSRWKEEGLDEYEDDEEADGFGYGYDDDEEEEEEEGDEEEVVMKPTQEELDYLEIRERLKEKIRRKNQRENAGRGCSTAGSVEKKKTHQANSEFGSFFGPSVPAIAKRVLEESHSSRAEIQHHINSKSSHSHSDGKRPTTTTSHKEKNIRPSKPVNEMKTKVEKLKDIRDYSFLFSDDADLPGSLNEPPSKNLHTAPVQASPKPRVPTSNHSRPLSKCHDLKHPTYIPGKVQQKSGFPKLSNSTDSRSKLSGSGPGRPLVKKFMSNSSQSMGMKKPSNMAPNRSSLGRNNTSMKPDSSNKRYEDQRKGMQRSGTMAPPRQLSSKPSNSRIQQPISSSKLQLHSSSSKNQQVGYSSNPHRPDHMMRPPRPGQSSKPQQQGYSSKPRQPGSVSKSQPSRQPPRQVQRQGSNEYIVRKKPMKRHFDDDDDDDGGGGGDYRSMIRKMFKYNPNKFHDDDDDANMEANFDDILKEERRSAILAKREDEEQLRLIEEEEERERMRKKRRNRG